MKCFSIFDVMSELNNLDFEFTDDTSIDFSFADFVNFTRWKTKNIPTIDDGRRGTMTDAESLTFLWNQFVLESADNYTRIKNALGLTYEVLDNYNGITEQTTVDTFENADALTFTGRTDTKTLNHSDALTFTGRQDTTTLAHSDELRFANRQDTETLNTTERNESDTLAPKTTTTTIDEHKTVSHYTTGFNSDTAVLSNEDVTTASASDDNGTTVVESGATNKINTGTITNGKTGTETTSHSGTITDGKTGTETTTHSGTITDDKTGTETTSHSGTITHEFEEIKHGNLGVTTSQQMLESEITLRLRYKLRPLIVKDFIDRYFFV